jgi:hypothetical protein
MRRSTSNSRLLNGSINGRGLKAEVERCYLALSETPLVVDRGSLIITARLAQHSGMMTELLVKRTLSLGTGWQREEERAALSCFTLDAHGAAQFFRDTFDDR